MTNRRNVGSTFGELKIWILAGVISLHRIPPPFALKRACVSAHDKTLLLAEIANAFDSVQISHVCIGPISFWLPTAMVGLRLTITALSQRLSPPSNPCLRK